MEKGKKMREGKMERESMKQFHCDERIRITISITNTLSGLQ